MTELDSQLTAVVSPAAVSVNVRPISTPRLLADLLRSPSAIIGILIIGFWAFMAVFWEKVVPFSPTEQHVRDIFQGPSGRYWFGTDQFGRDVFSRVMAGSHDILTVAPLATAVGLLLGTTVGLVAGYKRGWFDEVLSRILDVIQGFPIIILYLLVLSTFGSTLQNQILSIGFIFTAPIARVVRAAVLEVREMDFIAAARMRGENSFYIMFREILPNIISPLIVEGTLRIGYAIFASATLSFLGLGLPPPSPDWGLQVSLNRNFIPFAPWTVAFPALAIASLVIGVNLVAEQLDRVRQL